jgi:hypothetical protein
MSNTARKPFAGSSPAQRLPIVPIVRFTAARFWSVVAGAPLGFMFQGGSPCTLRRVSLYRSFTSGESAFFGESIPQPYSQDASRDSYDLPHWRFPILSRYQVQHELACISGLQEVVPSASEHGSALEGGFYFKVSG